MRLTWIVVATAMTTFLSTYLAAAVNLALKDIGVELSANPAELSLVAAVYLLFTSLCLIPFGKLCDAYGPKRTLLIGCAFFTLSNLVVPLFVTSFASLLFFRGFQGIGAAFMLVSTTPVVTALCPKERRATALGFLVGMIYFGYSVGNFLGGLLTESFGWRSIFTAAALGGVLAFVAVWVTIPEVREENERKGRLDIPGILLYAGTLICLQAGASRMNRPLGVVLLMGCALGFVLFVRQEKRAADPILDVALFTENRLFALSNMAVFFSFLATYGSQYLLPLYLQCNRGMSPLEAGRMTLLQPLMQLIFSPLAGFFADRTAPSTVASAGMAMIAAALFLLAFLTETTPYGVIYLALILIGMGISFFSAPNTTLIMDSVPAGQRGMASASNSIMRNLGMQCSIILCGCAFLFALGDVKGIPPERYGEMLTATRFCYGIFAVLCVVGTVISLRRLDGDPTPGVGKPQWLRKKNRSEAQT